MDTTQELVEIAKEYLVKLDGIAVSLQIKLVEVTKPDYKGTEGMVKVLGQIGRLRQKQARVAAAIEQAETHGG